LWKKWRDRVPYGWTATSHSSTCLGRIVAAACPVGTRTMNARRPPVWAAAPPPSLVLVLCACEVFPSVRAGCRYSSCPTRHSSGRLRRRNCIGPFVNGTRHRPRDARVVGCSSSAVAPGPVTTSSVDLDLAAPSWRCGAVRCFLDFLDFLDFLAFVSGFPGWPTVHFSLASIVRDAKGKPRLGSGRLISTTTSRCSCTRKTVSGIVDL